MPITYLDEAPRKARITYLDEELQIEQRKPFVGDLLPKFSITPKLGEMNETTITLQDIISGTMPLKGMRALSSGLSNRMKGALGTENISNKPIMPQTGLLPTSPANVGAMVGARATPRQIAEGAIDIAASPETYAGMEFARPGLISKPLQGLERFGEGGILKARKPFEGLANITRGGLPKEEAVRIATEYGNSNATLVDKVKNLLAGKLDEANIAYKTAVNNFKNTTIQSTDFARTIKTGLQEKGWLDLQGNPTTRYKSGLDPVVDKLTNLYLDHIQNPLTSTGKKVTGQVMSKADFLTYRDALGGMLKEKPSDVLVMNARNSLYNSAEKSGMKGIKAARDLEKTAYGMEDKFLNRNTGDLKIANEQALSRIGTEKTLSKQQLDHIRELEKYVGHPIEKDAAMINKLNKAIELTQKRKGQLKGQLKAGAIGAGLTYLGMGGAKKFIQ